MSDEPVSPNALEEIEENDADTFANQSGDEVSEEKSEIAKYDAYNKQVFGSDDSDDEQDDLGGGNDDSDASDFGDTQDLEQLGKGQLDKLVKAKAPKRKASTTEKPSKKKRKAESGEERPAKSPATKKTQKRKTRTDEEILVIVEDFMDKIRNAYEDDEILSSQRKPATNKLKLLDQLQAHATHAEFQEKFIQRNLLEELARWLQPDRRDKSLPNIRIREVILHIVDRIRIEYLDSNIVKDSGIGKMVYLYSVHPKETPTNSKFAGQIMSKWMRNIFGNGEERMIRPERKPRRVEAAAPSPQRSLSESYDDGDDNRWHPKIPQPVTFDFGRISSNSYQSDNYRNPPINESAEARKQRLTKNLSNIQKR